MLIQEIELDKIIPYQNNARVNDSAIKSVCKSLQEFGWQQPIVVDKQMTIIVGHTRLKAAQKLGYKTAPVKIEKDLSPDKVRMYRLQDNNIKSEWDFQKLEFECADLSKIFDFKAFDFDPFGTQEEIKEGLTEDDAVPEVTESICKLGDLWELGEHRLLCGDSTKTKDVERLMNGEKADMVFTDPPYGYKYKSNHQDKHDMLLNDDKILDFLPVCYDNMENNSCIYLCTSHQVIDVWKPLIEKSFKYKNMIVWKKNNWSMGDLKGAYAGQHEIILFAHKGSIILEGSRDTDIWEFKRTPPIMHPTQKTIELIVYAITKVNCNRILDLFLGSGSTLIACEKTGRKCYGMELDPKYCDVIIKRWSDFTGKEVRKL